MEVAVEGYGYHEFYNPVDQNKYWNQDVYDYQALQTDHAHAKVCRDRGSLYPDNCSTAVSTLGDRSGRGTVCPFPARGRRGYLLGGRA